jgi:hypothetical protein
MRQIDHPKLQRRRSTQSQDWERPIGAFRSCSSYKSPVLTPAVRCCAHLSFVRYLYASPASITRFRTRLLRQPRENLCALLFLCRFGTRRVLPIINANRSCIVQFSLFPLLTSPSTFLQYDCPPVFPSCPVCYNPSSFMP